MDDLDREIEEAARAARSRVRRGRLATVASTATLLLVGVGGTVLMFQLFPEPDVSDFETQRRQTSGERTEEVTVSAIADDYAAQRNDQGRTRWKVAPGMLLGFAAAIYVRKRLQPPS